MARTLGYAGAKRSFAAMLDAFRPDVVHLNNIHSYLSPVIAEVAARRGIKTVWTLHAYRLVGPACAGAGYANPALPTGPLSCGAVA